MKEIIVPMLLLLLLGVVIPVTSSMDSVQLVSFNKSRKIKDGPAMCAVDVANETKTSSLQYCLRDCARDGTCTNFNIKNSDTCDIYNYEPRILIAMPGCENYKVPVIHCITRYHTFGCSRPCKRSVSGRFATQRFRQLL